MNCPYCGAVNAEGSSVCATCGQQLVAQPPAPPVPPAAPAPPAGYAQPPAPPAPPAGYAQPPAPPAAPAGYAQPGYQQPYAQPQPQVKSNMVLAILATVLCCIPLGIVAIVNAAQVSSKLAAGDVAGAQKASKNAAMWSWIAIGAGFLGGIAYAGLMMLGALAEMGSF